MKRLERKKQKASGNDIPYSAEKILSGKIMAKHYLQNSSLNTLLTKIPPSECEKV